MNLKTRSVLWGKWLAVSTWAEATPEGQTSHNLELLDLFARQPLTAAAAISENLCSSVFQSRPARYTAWDNMTRDLMSQIVDASEDETDLNAPLEPTYLIGYNLKMAELT